MRRGPTVPQPKEEIEENTLEQIIFTVKTTIESSEIPLDPISQKLKYSQLENETDYHFILGKYIYQNPVSEVIVEHYNISNKEAILDQYRLLF